MKTKKILLLTILILIQCITLSHTSQRNEFVYSELKYDGNWNPYPNLWIEICKFYETAVNIRCEKSSRILTLKDDGLFSSPFIVLAGNKALPDFKDTEIESLKKYLLGGGILFVNDTSISRNSLFDISVKELLNKTLPEYDINIIPDNHAVYKSFYLVRIVSGRRLIFPYLEGVFIDGKLRVIISRNDLLGAWVKDSLGNYLYDCLPGGYEQRKEAFKLTINILVYSVTGTYKEDVIHRPYIEKKTYELFK